MEEMIDRAEPLMRHLSIERSTTYGYPALKVGGKVVANYCRYPGTLSVHCPIELKAVLIEAEPDIYYDTDHFAGWPAVLVRMDVIGDEALAGRLEAAWLERAPRKLVKAYEAQRSSEA